MCPPTTTFSVALPSRLGLVRSRTCVYARLAVPINGPPPTILEEADRSRCDQKASDHMQARLRRAWRQPAFSTIRYSYREKGSLFSNTWPRPIPSKARDHIVFLEMHRARLGRVFPIWPSWHFRFSWPPSPDVITCSRAMYGALARSELCPSSTRSGLGLVDWGLGGG